jgi:hypothetical protein
MRCWGSVRLYFMMSICRPKFLISGSDSLILFEGIQLVGHISSWLLSRVLLWVQLTNLSSTNNPFECIYFRLETIERQVAYKSKLDIPRHHYSRWSPVRRQLNIYSYPAASSVLFGRQFGLGLISHWWTHTLSDHFVQFTYSAGGPRARRSFLQIIWLLCVWIVWNEHN